MRIIKTVFDTVHLIEPSVFSDTRGFFFESYNQRAFTEIGIVATFVQDNHSRSRKSVIRGLHYQAPPFAQDKLVRTIAGEVYDVVVDLREGSASRGQWAGFVLSEQNQHLLFVPKGFAHGFYVLSDSADVLYKCSDFYQPDSGRGIRWNDPDLAVDWPTDEPVLSDQDLRQPLSRDLQTPFPAGTF